MGNGLALLGITTVIGEFFLLYFAKEKKNIAEKKYDYVTKRRNAVPQLPVPIVTSYNFPMIDETSTNGGPTCPTTPE